MKKRKIIRLTIFFALTGLLIYYFYPESRLPNNTQIDSIVVYKSKRKMLVYSSGKLQKIYKIWLIGQNSG